LAEAGPRLLPNWDPIGGERFREVLGAAGVEVLINEPIALPPTVVGNAPNYKLSIGAVVQPDVTLVATCRKANSDDLGLESVGLTAGAWIAVNEQMRTPIQSIFAVADHCLRSEDYVNVACPIVILTACSLWISRSFSIFTPIPG
jgi:pyruvate/2-oxoglutarate dehydrogenase complex dihydrolipoamide dehydrogenase (E3) component